MSRSLLGIAFGTMGSLIGVAAALTIISWPHDENDFSRFSRYYKDVLRVGRGYPEISEEIINSCWKEVGLADKYDLAKYLWKINGKKPKSIAGDKIRIPIYCEEQKINREQ